MGQVMTEFAMAFLIVCVCVVLHSYILVVWFEWLVDRRETIQQKGEMKKFTLFLITTFAIIIVLHIIETGIWASFYYWRRLFDDFETSLYFSLSSYTTIGYGDVVLPRRWRLLGAIEGISGVLLCGLSTAFVFALINAGFNIRIQRRLAKGQL
jgi:Ion channel